MVLDVDSGGDEADSGGLEDGDADVDVFWSDVVSGVVSGVVSEVGSIVGVVA